MKKFWFLIIILILILISLTSYYFVYPQVAKKTVYSIDNKSTLYPGFGKITKHVDKYLLVEPIGEGQSFYAPYENKGRYLDFKYKVIEIEEQDKIDYVVGKFKGWEDIENSLDKYILINYNDITEKWRVSFSGNSVSFNEATKLGIENIDLIKSNSKNEIQKPNPFLISEIGFERIKDLIKKDDIIVLLPVIEEPILNKRDTNGELMTGWIIIRRFI
jgi:hypothetical protein